jgi:pectate lyase
MRKKLRHLVLGASAGATALALAGAGLVATNGASAAETGAAAAAPVSPLAAVDQLVGWATQNGGTTGGGGAATTTVTSASALTTAVGSSSAAVIRVSGTISCSGMLRVRSNKTIIGNSGATIVGCGLNVNGDRNVIIRNITFRDWTDDAINVQTSATNIWIDHNTFSNGHDGAVDIKRGSDFVTVSWNRVFNHDKSMLLGHSDDNGSQDIGHLRVTYHHNWFDASTQRHPRVRFGNPVHVYNNYYYKNSGYGVASTEGAGVLVENNSFESVPDPFHLGEADSGPGTLVARGNLLVGSGSGQTGGSVKSIPYAYTMDAASSVKSIVTANAGAGRISL